VFLLVFAGHAGAVATAMALWSHGALLALAAAPLGGSLAALLGTGLVAWGRRSHDSDARADAMVADLRAMVARAQRDGAPASQPAHEAARDAA
jgi:hypothetical protein